jgi:TolA-binding protein
LRQAESIVSALETDPEGTLQALQRSFGIELTTPRENEDWEELDPTEQKLLQLEKKIEQQEATQRQQTVEREVNQLQESYGDFDAKELLRHAVKHGISNLEAAYTHWRFGDVKATADKLQQEQEITQKKRDASVITPGGSTQAGTQQTQSDAPASSIREAFALAKKQLST